MEFKQGDQVKVIDDLLEGLVTKVEADWISFTCEDGFEYRYRPDQLIKIENGKAEYTILAKPILEEDKKRTGINYSQKVKLEGKVPVIDLHLESLLDENEQLRSAHALAFQLSCVQEAVRKASVARIRRLVFVHGRGSGILKSALRQLLDEQFPHIEYFDASYQKFGQGATEIIIHGLGKAGKQ